MQPNNELKIPPVRKDPKNMPSTVVTCHFIPAGYTFGKDEVTRIAEGKPGKRRDGGF